MKIKIHLLLSISLIVLFSVINIKCDTLVSILAGIIRGTVQSSNGSLALGETQVEVSTGGGGDNLDTLITFTDRNGNYEFTNVTPGQKRIKFTKGSFVEFKTITLQSDQGQQVDAKLQPVKKLGFFAGRDDNIQSIVRGLGYQLDSLRLTSFNSVDTLNKYSIIFLNSSSTASSQLGNFSSNIQTYLDSGGKIYSSDSLIDLIVDMGLVFGQPQLNGDSQTVNANVIDMSLISFLGKNTASIRYQASKWSSLNLISQPSEFKIFTRGTYTVNSGQTITNETLSFSKPVGQNGGELIYTTFRNEPNVTQDVINILKFYIFEL